jgi:hypothetical protein
VLSYNFTKDVRPCKDTFVSNCEVKVIKGEVPRNQSVTISLSRETPVPNYICGIARIASSYGTDYSAVHKYIRPCLAY